MKVKRKYARELMKLVKQEIKNPLTSGVEITRKFDEPDGTVLVISIKQENFIPFFSPMDIAPGEVNANK